MGAVERSRRWQRQSQGSYFVRFLDSIYSSYNGNCCPRWIKMLSCSRFFFSQKSFESEEGMAKFVRNYKKTIIICFSSIVLTILEIMARSGQKLKSPFERWKTSTYLFLFLWKLETEYNSSLQSF